MRVTRMATEIAYVQSSTATPVEIFPASYSVTVMGFIISGSMANNKLITLTDADGNVLFEYETVTHSTVMQHTGKPFLLENGLSLVNVNASGNASCMVFHVGDGS